MIYLASPYTHSDLKVMQLRYDLTCEACAELIKKSYKVFSPIAHWHPIAVRYDLPRDYIFWRSWNEEMIIFCKGFWILTLDGWKDSSGIKSDSEYAKSNIKTITHISLEECIS